MRRTWTRTNAPNGSRKSCPRGRTARRRRRRRRRPSPPPRKRVSVWAILVAAGRGERLGLEQPKAFAKLGEDPLLAEPLRRLDESDWIDRIAIGAAPGGGGAGVRLGGGGAGDPARRGACVLEGACVRARRSAAHRFRPRGCRRGARGSDRRARAR